VAAVRRVTAALLCLLGLALAACGAPAEARGDAANDAPKWRGTVLATPWAKPEFTLTDDNGQPFDFRAQTDGYLTLLFFGYTHCPDVCPLHMANISAVLEELPGDVRVNTKVVFATTDPARDTPAVLKKFLDNFDPTFIGLTGTAQQMDDAQRATGIPVSVAEPPKADGSYTVGHAAQVIAYTRDGEAHVVYPFGTRQSDWADDLPRLLSEPAWNPGTTTTLGPGQ
jgi:protein SCO1/2